jgi:L-malate glycosyltransferase
MSRICLLADASSIHTSRWCKHFASLGYEMHVISFKEGVIEGTIVHFVDAGNVSAAGGNWKVLLKVGKVKKILKQIKPDVLHALYATSYGLVGALTRVRPYLITALGSDVLISAKQSKKYRFLVKYAFKRADHITAMAAHMKSAILEMGIPDEKISIVVFGIDPAIFNRNGRLANSDEFLITSTRNFEPVYNHQLLFDAIEKIKDDIKGLKIVLIGEGSQRIQFEHLAHERGLKELVSFTGRIPQAEIANTLRKTHLFVTLAFSDGNCISLNEAMACGTFSIACDIPATRQWIEEGQNGFLVPVNDPDKLAQKIREVYKNYNELIAVATPLNDKLVAEKAIWSVNMKKMDDIYKKFIQQTK